MKLDSSNLYIYTKTMVLIVVNDKELANASSSVKAEYLEKYTKYFNPHQCTFWTPTNYDEYLEAIKKPRPAIKGTQYHLHVVLGFFEQYHSLDTVDIGYFRMHDLFISNRGGIVIGDRPKVSDIAYQPINTKDIKKAVDSALYHNKLAFNTNWQVGFSYYIGPCGTPAAILYGFSLEFPKLSLGGLTCLGGLPEYKEFYKRVGWMRIRHSDSGHKHLKNSFEVFPSCARIAVSKGAHQELNDHNVPHVYLPVQPGKIINMQGRKDFGNAVVEKYEEYDALDLESWKPFA